MALLEKSVEAAAVSALKTAVGDIAPVIGFLQPSSEGTEKTAERTSVLVICRPRAGVFGSKRVTLSINVAIMAGMEDDPTGSKIAEIAEPVMALIDTWIDSPSTLGLALSVADVFRADGLITSDGGDAGDDTAQSIWFWTVPLQIKGVRLSPVETPAP